MKAQIPLIEMIVVVMALFVAFGVLFPGFVYENKWEEASILLKSRDLILTMDRIGKLYDFSFDKSALSEFLENFIKENLIAWSEIENTIPNQIVVACNCTEEEINKMNFWFNPLTINNRKIYLLFLKTNLEKVPVETDVLLIKGYKNLTDYLNTFKSYVARGMGIVEMMDFDSQEKIDITQKNIFGLIWGEPEQGTADMNFSKPTSAVNLTFYPYKYFYHVPLPVNHSLEESIAGCEYQPSAKGNLTLSGVGYTFWICDGTHVWFDMNADGINDTLIELGEKFNINEFKLSLNYIHDNSSIAVSFKPDLKFSGYFSYEEGGNKYIANITPIDGKKERVLLKAIKDGKEFPTVILNSSRIAWMYDFGDNPSDEEKNLLLSLLLWASTKKSAVLTSQIKTGFSTSYINLQNIDMFEVYKFTLGLGYPY